MDAISDKTCHGYIPSRDTYWYDTVRCTHAEEVMNACRNRTGDAMAFTIKDSGKREQFEGGMVRDTAEDKVNWALVADGPMLKRWATHLTNGAKKYAKRNWMLAQGEAEYERAKESAFRHFMQWYLDDRDEDHGAAVMFNINEAEYIRDRKFI